MKITDKVYKADGGCTVALGTFDGVHLGHRRVIETAKQFGLPVVVVTTAQNPQGVLFSGKKRRIFSEETTNTIFESLGVDGIIRLDFNDIRNMEPQAYLDMLVGQLGAKNIVFGFNFRFGKGASGNADTVCEYGIQNNIGVKVCDAVTFGDEAISSTRIRAAIEEGDMVSAAQMLGRNYSIDFPVVHGDARGRKMGFPTANQMFDEEFVLPRFGVYASRVTVGSTTYNAVTNIGIRPTFISPVVLAETYLDGFEGDLYSKRVEVMLLRHLRDEKKFDCIDALTEQLTLDLEQAKNIK